MSGKNHWHSPLYRNAFGSVRGVLHDDVHIGAAYAEGADSAKNRALIRQLAVCAADGEGCKTAEGRVWTHEVGCTRHKAMVQAKACLGKAREPCGCVQMSDVALERAKDNVPFIWPGRGSLTIGLLERGNLDGITQGGRSAMPFHKIHVPGIDAGQRDGRGYGQSLAADAWSRVADLVRAVVGGSACTDYCQNVVPVSLCICKALQKHCQNTVAKDGAIGACVVGAAASVRGAHPARQIDVAKVFRQHDRAGSYQGAVAVFGQKGLAGYMHAEQR